MLGNGGSTKSEEGGATIAVDPNGDLRLVVGSGKERSTFLVCSRSLARSSPVFKAMLYGSFREARPADINSWSVELPDDAAIPAGILFDIIHGRFSMVKSRIVTLDTMYKILSFTDKYDMNSLLLPWIQGWVSSVSPPQQPRVGPFGDFSWDILKAVAVSRQLGALLPLKELVQSIVMTTTINSSGQLVWGGYYRLGSTYSQQMPLSSPEIYQHAAELRLKLITEILKRLQTLVSALRAAIPTGKQGFCKINVNYYYSQGPQTSICQAATLGFITSVLGPAELKAVWTEPTLSRDFLTLYPSSVQDLVLMIKSITPKYHGDHHVCNPMPAVVADIESLITSNDGYLTDETLAYLERQRSKFGSLDFSGQSK